MDMFSMCIVQQTSPRARRYRNPHPRGTVARRAVARSRTLRGLDRSLRVEVVLGLITSVGEGLVSWPLLLGDVAQGMLLPTLVEVEGQQELLEIAEQWEEEIRWNGELKVDEWTLTSSTVEMRQTRGHLEPRDVCKKWVWRSNKTRLEEDYANVHFFITSSVEFHVLCVDLGFHVVIGVGRLIVRFHRTYTIPSFLVDVVVRLRPVNVKSDCNHYSYIFHIVKTGSFEVLSLQPKRDNEPSIQEAVDAVRVKRNEKTMVGKSDKLGSDLWCGRECCAKDREPHENHTCVLRETWKQCWQQEHRSVVSPSVLSGSVKSDDGRSAWDRLRGKRVWQPAGAGGWDSGLQNRAWRDGKAGTTLDHGNVPGSYGRKRQVEFARSFRKSTRTDHGSVMHSTHSLMCCGIQGLAVETPMASNRRRCTTYSVVKQHGKNPSCWVCLAVSPHRNTVARLQEWKEVRRRIQRLRQWRDLTLLLLKSCCNQISRWRQCQCRCQKMRRRSVRGVKRLLIQTTWKGFVMQTVNFVIVMRQLLSRTGLSYTTDGRVRSFRMETHVWETTQWECHQHEDVHKPKGTESCKCLYHESWSVEWCRRVDNVSCESFGNQMRASTWLQMRCMWEIWQFSLRSRVRKRVRLQVSEPLVVNIAMCWSYWRLRKPVFRRDTSLFCITDLRDSICSVRRS